MGLARHARAAAVAAVVTSAAVACSGSQPTRATLPVLRASRTPPRSHDAVLLHNDTSGTVRVVGCAGCPAAGTPVAAGEWLALNLPPDSSQLRLVQSTKTTCLMILNGIQSDKPLVVNVSESGVAAC